MQNFEEMYIHSPEIYNNTCESLRKSSMMQVNSKHICSITLKINENIHTHKFIQKRLFKIWNSFSTSYFFFISIWFYLTFYNLCQWCQPKYKDNINECEILILTKQYNSNKDVKFNKNIYEHESFHTLTQVEIQFH